MKEKISIRAQNWKEKVTPQHCAIYVKNIWQTGEWMFWDMFERQSPAWYGFCAKCNELTLKFVILAGWNLAGPSKAQSMGEQTLWPVGASVGSYVISSSLAGSISCEIPLYIYPLSTLLRTWVKFSCIVRWVATYRLASFLYDTFEYNLCHIVCVCIMYFFRLQNESR